MQMWQVFCLLAAADKGWSAYENLSNEDRHKNLKGFLDLAAMCTCVCYVFGKGNLAKMFSGKPPKN
jgi:hypothetical protein